MKSTNLTIIQGTPFRLLVRVKEFNDVGERVPMPLAGATIRLQARLTATSATPLLDLSSNGNGITFGVAPGEFIIEMTGAQTSALNWGERHPIYQCEVVPLVGDIFRALSGKIILDPEVVR